MRRVGRVGTITPAHFLPLLIHFYACISITVGTDYGVPIEIKVWDTGRTPIAHMVDVTNEFGLKVLAEHNFLNDNNIAFSPYGLMGILVALYEGVDGDSSYQIQRGIQLPWNRNVMRIGFRDIHRTLKTYFVPEEGFLAGLALNNENVTFNDSYKKVLRFYGFDLDNDQLPMFPPQGNSTIETNTVTPAMKPNGSTGDGTTITMSMATTSKPREETTQTSVKVETTTNPNAETIGDVDVQGSTVTTTVSPSLALNPESTTVPASTTVQVTPSEFPLVSTTMQVTTSVSPATETTQQQTTTTASIPSTETTSPNAQNILSTTETVTTTGSTSPTMGAETDGETISQQTSRATVALTVGVTANSEVDSIATSIPTSTVQPPATDTTTATPIVTTEGNTQTESMMTSSIAETQQTEQMSTTLAELTTAPDSSTSVVNDSTLETLQRRKKSIVDFIFTNPPYMDDYLLYRSFDIPAGVPNESDKNMFLVNGLKSVQVTYMHYDSILEHAYLPHLEASAVRLPLDSDRYYLLVVLPRRGGAAEVGRLLARMARESDLTDVYAALRPRRVTGIVPSFTVKGHVTLTTDLQKLGIRDVFEPRQRDFTPMTRQAGVYVRSIEQAVSVAIRKYRPDDHKKNRYVTNREPVTFYATYPFLYFVMDASIHVSLMAGKMVDPLNSRIL